MQVSSIIALLVCVVAYASAAPSVERLDLNTLIQSASIQQVADKVIAQLQAMLANTNNPTLQAAIQAAINKIQAQMNQRGVIDSLASVFGLSNVWSIISNLHSQASDAFYVILEKLLFASTNAWNAAKPILTQLASDLVAHATDAQPLIANAVASLTQVLAGSIGKREITPALARGFWDTVMATFGLNNIIPAIQALGTNMKDQFYLLLEKLMFAGTQAWGQAVPIFTQLVADLTNHIGGADQYFQTAMTALQGVLAASVVGKRDLIADRGFWDTLSNVFGLNTVWATITAVSGNIKDQFFLILEKLMFAGSAAWAQAKPIFSQLVSDLSAHASNAVPLLTAAVASLQGVLANSVGK